MRADLYATARILVTIGVVLLTGAALTLQLIKLDEALDIARGVK